MINFSNLLFSYFQLGTKYFPNFIASFFYLLIDTFNLINSDKSKVCIISYPKSGVTWLKYMLIQIISNNRLESVDLHDIADNKLDWSDDNSSMIFESGYRPNPHRLFLDGTRIKYRDTKIILLIRDPRDIIVSMYHQVTKRSKNPMKFRSISHFIRHPIFGMKRVIRFHDIWRKNSAIVKDMMVVTYDDLLENGPSTLSSIMNFSQITNTDESVIRKVYENSRADKMRRKEKANKIKGMKGFGNGQNSLKVRKAKSGSFKEELSSSDINYCNNLLAGQVTIYNNYF